jgi:hypothetical protein
VASSRQSCSDEAMAPFDINSAIIEPVKLRDYCLSSEHPRGKHKARVFQSALGLTRKDWRLLARAIRENLTEVEWVADDADEFGRRYHVDMNVEIMGRSAMVRTLWIVRRGEEFPRLSSCFVHP